VAKIEVPVVFVKDFLQGGEPRSTFVKTVGDSLRDIGFFAVADHDIPPALLRAAYDSADRFFDQELEAKMSCQPQNAAGQRGYTGRFVEHAKGSDAPDLKEFYQVGRVDVGDDHPVHQPYGPNVWPSSQPEFRESLSELYQRQDALGRILLRACALYLEQEESFFESMVDGGDTIVRVLYYPPVGNDAPEGAIRAAAHEDINLITLLPGATASGLELQDNSGAWLAIEAAHNHILVDSGDMLQNLTNGLFRSTTHRVVNPEDRTSKRYSMPCFIHPVRDADLSPLSTCLSRTGGEEKYPSISAGEYLRQRLAEIGL